MKQVSGCYRQWYYDIGLWEIPTLAWQNSCLAECQCRDFPQSYVVIPFAKATRNFFHNFFIA